MIFTRPYVLAALSDAPYAFGSTYDREITFSQEKWDERAGDGSEGKESICIIALDGDRVVGIAGGITHPEEDHVKQLVSMWVAADHRGTDIAARLVAQVEVWAFDRGAERIVLGVTAGNDRAARFYVRMGFEPCKAVLKVGSGMRNDSPETSVCHLEYEASTKRRVLVTLNHTTFTT